MNIIYKARIDHLLKMTFAEAVQQLSTVLGNSSGDRSNSRQGSVPFFPSEELQEF